MNSTNYTLNFPHFTRFPKPFISENQLFSLISSLMRLKQGKLFNYHPQPYPKALRKSALPLWLHGHIHSLWYSHPSVREVPAHPLARHPHRAGYWCRCGVTCGNENPPYPAFPSGFSGIRCLRSWEFHMPRHAAGIQGKFLHNPPEHHPYSAGCKLHSNYALSLLPVCNNYGGRVPHSGGVPCAVPFLLFLISPLKYRQSPQYGFFCVWLCQAPVCALHCCIAYSALPSDTVPQG